jgi:hypothetical protein
MDNWSEKRRHPRKRLHDQVLLQIGTARGDAFERAQVENISLKGICFTHLKALKGFESLTESVVENNQVLAYFHDNPITIFGSISRIDPPSDRLTLSIKRSTDDDLWERLCT